MRTLTEADLTAFSELIASAFLQDISDEHVDAERTIFEPDRAHGVFDGEAMIGCGELLSRRITMPGTGPTPFAAVTAIAVAPGHRRRGVLSMIMRKQLDGLRDTGEPIAALWASESGIYGRFGYGLATQLLRLAIPKGAPFRPGVELAAGRVRELPREQALPLIKEIYDKVAATQVGQLSRSAGDWAYRLHEAEFFRRGQTRYRFAVHPEAYAVYRARLEWQDRGPNSAVTVREVVAANPAAYATICRYLLDIDLVGEVSINGPMDCPDRASAGQPSGGRSGELRCPMGADRGRRSGIGGPSLQRAGGCGARRGRRVLPVEHRPLAVDGGRRRPADGAAHRGHRGSRPARGRSRRGVPRRHPVDRPGRRRAGDRADAGLARPHVNGVSARPRAGMPGDLLSPPGTAAVALPLSGVTDTQEVP